MGVIERHNACKFLTIRLGNVYGAMGLVGNIVNESGINFIANRMETSWKKKTGWNDGWVDGNTYKKELDTINPAINDGTYRNYRYNGDGTRYLATFKNGNCRDAFANDSTGFGLCQWTFPSRKYNLYDFCDRWCKSNQKPFEIGNLEMQLDFILHELQTSQKTTYGVLMTAKDILTASNFVCVNYERPQNFHTAEVQKQRYISGNMIYKEVFDSKDTQWFKYGSAWYYMSKGLIQFDKWVQDGGQWYHLGTDGKMEINKWLQYGGKWYYVGQNGACITNTSIVWQGKEYKFDGTGAMIED